VQEIIHKFSTDPVDVDSIWVELDATISEVVVHLLNKYEDNIVSGHNVDDVMQMISRYIMDADKEEDVEK